ncbi:MAG TPA: OsmC family protein [Polyangiaceae bacterium]|nr:OsmC family protein [Polyangiaceae bacterium]
MVDIDISYEGDLHCVAVHGPSGATLASDAPVDNHGKGESFSPTDLVATALGTCMLTVMGIRSKKEGWAIEGAKVHVRKGMTTTGPRRIARLEVKLTFPGIAPKDARAREILEQTANTCPVRLSLLEAIEVPIEFVWT